MKIRMGFFLAATALLAGRGLAQVPPTPRLFGVDDVFGAREVHDPQMTGEGRYIAYTVDSISLKDDKSETRIWMIPAAGGEAFPLTAEGVSSEHPRWSPDGQYLAFTSSRKDEDGNEGKSPAYLLNRLGGEPRSPHDTLQNAH